jgi:hypothetical protein
MPRSRTKSPPSRSVSPKRSHRDRRRRSRSRSRERSRHRERRYRDDRDYRSRHRDDRDRDYDRRERRRHKSRDRSSPLREPTTRPSSANNGNGKEPEAVVVVNNGAVITKPSTSFILPEEIKSEFLSILGTSQSDFAQNESVMNWIGEKVLEMVESKIGKIDEVVRERVAKEKLEMEARLRVQIQQEMKEEMDAAQKRQEEAQQRCIELQEQLTQKIKDQEDAQKAAVRFIHFLHRCLCLKILIFVFPSLKISTICLFI